MSPQLEIQLIAVIVAMACSLPGVFLVLRTMSMMSDSVTHTILLGIVLAFLVVHDLSSPFLIVGATLMGVATVWLTELLHKTRLVSEDSAIGVVFPLLFSIAIILITRYTGSVHLDTDSVLLGELAFAPFDRMVVAGVDIGAKALYPTTMLLLINLIAIVLFLKEFKLSTFDPVLAAALGFSPILLHYGLMTLVSVTAVGAFQAVGSVLVVAFMIGPPVTAYLLTDDLKKMLAISVSIGALSGLSGYWLASALDASIAGSMAVMVGVIFLLVFLTAPKRGFVCVLIRRRKQRLEFAQNTLLLYLYNQRVKQSDAWEAARESLAVNLKWSYKATDIVLDQLRQKGQIDTEGHVIKLTNQGLLHCKLVMEEYCIHIVNGDAKASLHGHERL